jgi:hypothetical protein
MAGPIKPSDMVALKTKTIPEEVFQVFNEAIVAAWDGRGATLMQNRMVAAIVDRLGVCRSEVFDLHLLDVEESYRAAGWNVEYDKPGYNETYEASFRFTRASGHGSK